MSLFDNETPRHNLRKTIEVREGRLYGDSPSAHVPTWTGDCFELAKSWITDCQVAHINHCSQNVSKGSEPYWPTILLYVGDLLRDLRLDETSFIASALPAREYLALSYCRSQSGLPMAQKLTLTKKDEWKKHINREDLPLTFQHAIQFTRQPGFKYLWIDALCIIQDCPELWKYETQNMGKVFANAHCTIATSSDVNSGLFYQRTSSLLDFPCHLRFSKNIAMTIRAKRRTYSSKSFTEEVDRKKLSWQAQGFQERLLSRRILHFGPKFLFFECNTYIASEAMVAGQPFREKLWFWERLYHAKRRKFQLQRNAIYSVFNPVTGYRSFFNELRANRSTTLSLKEELHLHKTWFELVCRFTRSNMMEPSDRTLAIVGLSQAIQDREEKLQCWHGLWRRHFLFDLLWFISSGHTKMPSSEHRTLSWSWQSVEGEICISHESWVIGKERGWMKVAEVVNRDVEDYLLLKCPLFRCTNAFSSRNMTYILQLNTPNGRVEAVFAPDFLDFDQENLIGAEIIRSVILRPGRSGQRKVEAIETHGIVLQRNHVIGGQGGQVTYERVGRFWMQWPLVVDEGDPRTGNMAREILGRRSGVVVRIE